MLTAFIDFKAPASYLALMPTLELLAEKGTDVSWRPFRCWERPLPSQVADETVSANHRLTRLRSLREIHEHYAKLRGLTMRWREESGSTDLALGLLALWPGDPLRFVEACYRAYWSDGADLNCANTVHAIAGVSGWSDAYPQSGEVCAALDQAQREGEERGVVDAPAFIVGEQLVVGREHMPWLRERL